MNIKLEQATQLKELFRSPTFRLFQEILEDYQVENTNKLINAPYGSPSYATYVAHITGVIKGLEYIQKVELHLENIVKKANENKYKG